MKDSTGLVCNLMSCNSSRRMFLKTSIGAGAGTILLEQIPVKASPTNILSDDRLGVLVDTAVCVGCRSCEYACRKAHKLKTTEYDTYKDRRVYKKSRRPNPNSLTVVNEYENVKNKYLPIDVKVQCMHCDHPACVSACIVGAITKLENGAVVWDTDKCIGCRYCMVACPFQIPTFDYDKAMEPKINKCDFCIERQRQNLLPACVEICPNEALLFGKRSQIIEIARNRIKRKPDIYINHIYGEKEAGGTSWIYIAGRDFNELGFPKLPNKAVPGTSEAIQHGIFSYFMPPIALYALLGSLMWINRRRKEEELI